MAKRALRQPKHNRKARGDRSVIQWIGNHYKMIGNAAKPETEKFWKRLRRFIASNSTRIPGSGVVDGPFPEIYAFKSALEEIQNGRARAANPDMG